MTPDDAAKLLAACAAFDNRKPSEAVARAWAVALRDLPLDRDCFDAVARFYGTPPKNPGDRLWIQPHDVRTHRHAIRAERLANFVYEGDPDEDPRQYLARYRGRLAATAAGEIAPAETAPMLTGGPHEDVAKQLAAVGRTVPGEDGEEQPKPRRGPLGVECPVCHAPIGRPCKTALRGRNAKSVHPARRRVAKGEPAYRETPEEIEQRRAAALAALERQMTTEESA
ncbi:hypothetical protein [Streptomyces sp. DH37]|uniref:zinc finger domain-containing protein n=1 Tax=Streptomyces sp. DH37 TaxID=3040122 RepID=UPI0024435D2C|nr:hypothetical protein [Streptomyces sp. DH37]MDG9701711.1 hypothetical protein [Streptomyces sp. DH37]